MLMIVFTNLLIIALIVGYAGWQLTKTFNPAKKGKCAACAYDCVLKKAAASRSDSAKI